MKLPERMITSGKLPAVKNLLLVGTALIFSAMITPAMAGKPVCDEGPPCKSSDDSVDAEYSAFITGDVTGESDDNFNWLGSFGGKSTIGLNSARGANPGDLDLGVLASLFTDKTFNGNDGIECFGADAANQILNGVNVKQGGAGNLNGKFFFDASTGNGSTPVIYLLEVFGDEIDNDWPPTATSTLIMTSWELSVQNVGKSVKAVSCIGDGRFDMEIEVTNVTPSR